jgi:hypothetical protein
MCGQDRLPLCLVDDEEPLEENWEELTKVTHYDRALT